jgi:hypothetical protein
MIDLLDIQSAYKFLEVAFDSGRGSILIADRLGRNAKDFFSN